MLTLFFFIALLWSNKEDAIASTQQHFNTPVIEKVVDSTIKSPTEAGFSLSLPSSNINIPHLQNAPRRHSNGQRFFFAPIRAGKALNASYKITISNNPQHKKASFSEPSNRLIRLRKLII